MKPVEPTIPAPWRIASRGIAIRLFLTCWLVYALHFATDIVREIYPALAIGDHFSFRVDEYANLHPDLFEKEDYGWHIGNNPGASMLAAIPYAIFKPVIDHIVDRVQYKRNMIDETEPPLYNTPYPLQRKFYAEAWRRGFDIKFGLAAFIMHLMCMAPISALGVVVMFFLLRHIVQSDKTALWLSLLYAFGTPVFFRTGFLNQNLMLGHFVFIGFILLWNPTNSDRLSSKWRYFLGGLTSGVAVLCDYSGVVFLLGLFFYGMIKALKSTSKSGVIYQVTWYILGTLGPIFLLWYYQWISFGHPFLPGQHWMPPVEWIELGYQGYGLPQFELFIKLAFDHRFGLFVSSPLMLLALFAPMIKSLKDRAIPILELVFILILFGGLWFFFSGSNYTRLQYNTGIRYMIPILPFLFVLAATVLIRLPNRIVYFICIFSVTESWCLAMYREVEHSLGVLYPILHIFLGGFKLPALTTLSRMGDQYGEYFANGVSPLPFFILTAAILFGIWKNDFKTNNFNPKIKKYAWK